MIIDFDQMQESMMPQFRGGEKETALRVYEDTDNKIAFGRLEPGATVGVHVHETNSEIIYIVRGTGKVLYDGGYEAVSAGICHYCPKGHEHSLINDGDTDLLFFAVVPEHGE